MTKVFFLLLAASLASSATAQDSNLPIGNFCDADSTTKLTIFPGRAEDSVRRVRFDDYWLFSDEIELHKTTDCEFGDTCYTGSKYFELDATIPSCVGDTTPVTLEVYNFDGEIYIRTYRVTTIQTPPACSQYDFDWDDDVLSRSTCGQDDD